MRSKKVLVGAGLVMATACASAQQFDMAAVQRWNQAKVAHYTITGHYDGWTEVSDWAHRQDRESGQVQATDTVTLDFDWDIRAEKPVGAVKIQNAKTSTKGTRNTMDKRIAPVLRGDYEHIEVTSVTIENGGTGTLNGTRTYPDAELALDYPGSMAMKPAKGEVLKIGEHFGVPNPQMMGMAGAMPEMNSSTGTNMSFSPDKKSFVMKDKGWTWTYTPTVLK